jgi:hypothetical protein
MTTILEAVAGLFGGILAGSVLFEIGGYFGIVWAMMVVAVALFLSPAFEPREKRNKRRR